MEHAVDLNGSLVYLDSIGSHVKCKLHGLAAVSQQKYVTLKRIKVLGTGIRQASNASYQKWRKGRMKARTPNTKEAESRGLCDYSEEVHRASIYL